MICCSCLATLLYGGKVMWLHFVNLGMKFITFLDWCFTQFSQIFHLHMMVASIVLRGNWAVHMEFIPQLS